jgi:outer membrane receptor protein involved in Fe transport
MIPRRPRCLIALVFSIVPAAVPAQTPPASTPHPPTIHEQVEVVATRQPEAPHEVPLAIEVISGDELRDRGITDLRGALSLATGVDVAPGGDGGPASAVPEFWGLKEFDAFLLVVDDVPWGGAFNPALSTIDLNDVERIEILRGPAPVMFGATSFVGVIHIVHKSPGNLTQTFTARAGSFSSGGGSATFAMPLGNWQSRLTVDGERQGFSDDRTSFRRGHARWRTSKASTAGRVWFGADATLLNQDPASPHVRQGAALSTATPLDANYNPAGAFLNDRRVAAFFGMDRTSGPRTWTTTAALSHASADILRGFLQSVTDSGLNARGLREQIDLTDLYVDSHAAWTSVPRLRLMLGSDFLHGAGAAKGAAFDYHVPLSGATATGVTVPSVLTVGIDDRRDFAGAYASAEWTPAPRLRIDAGVRLNITNEEREGGDEAAKPAGGADAGAQTNGRPSGGIGAIWSAWTRDADHVRLFTNYRNAFKPAAIDFGIGEEESEKEQLLKPETSQSYEGGMKIRTWQGRVAIEATTFLMNFSNLVIARTVNGLPSLTNAGTQRFKGFELGTAWYLPQNVTARTSYSFHDARFVDFIQEFDPGVPTELGGKRLEMSARHLASAGVTYAPARGATGFAEMNVVGSRFLNKRNTALAGGYAVLAAGVGYRTGMWELRVDGRNLTDERPPVAESELGDAQYYRLPARRIDATITVRVGR